jgi:segregation and condensation protein B
MDRFPDGLPFQARIEEPAADKDRIADAGMSAAATDDDWSISELEAAYQRALDAADSVAEQIEATTSATDIPASNEPPSASQAASSDRPTESARPSGASGVPPGDGTDSTTVSTEKVLEALLFVGGDPLTGRRLAELVGGDHLHDHVDELIARLDARYTEQGRPYHVQVGEGGYRLNLRPEFEAIRHRVYGLGPKDVRLSLDALEVLALVAYRQPIGRPAIEETGKPNVAGVLRQLLRLELIALERGDGGKDDVSYHTTQRFLDLFALDRLEDLPHPEDLMFR